MARRKYLAVEKGSGLAQLTSANLSLGFNFNPKAGKNARAAAQRNLTEAEMRDLDFINSNPNLYVDFNIPWSLAVQYNAQYFKIFSGTKRSQINQNAMLSGDIRLSEKWKIGASAPYDFQLGKLASTSLNIYRDLHCWEMRMYIQVYGTRPMYTFDINVKASMLQDLKLSKRNSFYDR